MTSDAATATSFDELLGPMLEAGYVLAAAMLGDRNLAEDAVQEASIRAWRKLHTVRDRGALKSWFLSIVANQCRTMRRGRWFSIVPIRNWISTTPSHESVVVEGIDAARALSRLKPEDRAALVLHFYYEMTYAEIGSCLGLSMTAARSRIHRAVRRIRPELETTEVD